MFCSLLQANKRATLAGNKLVTSENFFEFLCCGKYVFMSNLASMAARYPQLCVFKEMKLFQSGEWKS